MSQRSMDCAEIRDALKSGSVPAGPGVESHVRECGACGELLRGRGELGRALSGADAPAGPSVELWSSLERTLAAEAGPRAWLRSRATPVRLLVALLAAVAIVAYGGRASEGVVPAERPVAWLVVFALAGLTCLWTFVAPLGRARPTPAVRFAVVFGALSLPLLYASMSSVSPALPTSTKFTFAEQAFGCFAYGTLLALPLLVVIWALERSDRPWLTLTLGIGAVAGLVANSALALHCPNTEPAHIAAGHATIGAALACLGALWSTVATKWPS